MHAGHERETSVNVSVQRVRYTTVLERKQDECVACSLKHRGTLFKARTSVGHAVSEHIFLYLNTCTETTLSLLVRDSEIVFREITLFVGGRSAVTMEICTAIPEG